MAENREICGEHQKEISIKIKIGRVRYLKDKMSLTSIVFLEKINCHTK